VHVLLALLDQDGGSIKPLLTQMGVNTHALRAELVKELERIATVSVPVGDVPDFQRIKPPAQFDRQTGAKAPRQFLFPANCFYWPFSRKKACYKTG